MMFSRRFATSIFTVSALFACFVSAAPAAAERPPSLQHLAADDWRAIEALAAKIEVKPKQFKVDVEAPKIDTRAFPKKKLLQVETGGSRKVKGIWIVGYKLDNLDDFALLTDLRTLVVVNCGVKEVGNLGIKPKLRQLILMKNKLASTAGLEGLSVEHVDLRSNKLEAADELSTASKAVEVYLDNNQLKSLPNLTGLRMLKELRVAHNKLTSFDGSSLPQPRRAFDSFESVNLSNNKISDVSNLDAAVVRHIDLSNNNLTSMPELSDMLNSITLRKNKIRRAFGVLDAIEGRKEALFVDLRSNKLGAERKKILDAGKTLHAKKITVKL